VTIARVKLINDQCSGTYHLISRCVRRAFLCGDACEHRRAWLEAHLRTQASAFAIEVLTFAVMSNHLHIVVRTRPEWAAGWSAREVVERWGVLFPAIDEATGESGPWPDDAVAASASDSEWVETRRDRLASCSWFMRLLKQRVARKANKEDKVTGHFWEGRFQSVALLDDAAVIACMAYVDLNPVRARMATTPEASNYTGAQRRIQKRQEQRAAETLRNAAEAEQRDRELVQARAELCAEHGLWIAPCLRATNEHLDTDAYLDLVDQTGRLIEEGKRGTIPAHLLPILQRLDLDVGAWSDVMLGAGHFRGAAVGNLANLIAEAARRGLQWIVDRTRIHVERRQAH
jgi:REP element-mobilizing transposase RayT